MKSLFLPKYELSRILPSLHRAEILTIFCLYFWRNNDLINSFWNCLTFIRFNKAFKTWWGHEYMVDIICFPLVGVGLRCLPKLDVDTSPCLNAHRHAWVRFWMPIIKNTKLHQSNIRFSISRCKWFEKSKVTWSVISSCLTIQWKSPQWVYMQTIWTDIFTAARYCLQRWTTHNWI